MRLNSRASVICKNFSGLYPDPRYKVREETGEEGRGGKGRHIGTSSFPLQALLSVQTGLLRSATEIYENLK
jgi:hypothetical protein